MARHRADKPCRPGWEWVSLTQRRRYCTTHGNLWPAGGPVICTETEEE